MLTLILYLMIFDNNSSNSNATTESNSSNLSINSIYDNFSESHFIKYFS